MGNVKKIARIVAALLAGTVTAYLLFWMLAEHRRITAVSLLVKPATMVAHEKPRPNPDHPTIAAYNRLFDLFATYADSEQYNRYRDRFLTATSCFEDGRTWQHPSLVMDGWGSLVAEIRATADLGGPVRPLDFSMGYAMDLTHLATLTRLAETLCLDALFSARQGHAATAIDDIIAGMKIGDALLGEPTLMSQRTRLHIRRTMCQSVVTCFAPGDLSAPHLQRLLPHLRETQDRHAFAQALAGDAQLGLRTFAPIRQEENAEDWRHPFVGPSASWFRNRTADLYAGPLGKPWVALDEAVYAGVLKRMIAAVLMPYGESRRAFAEIQAQLEKPNARLWAPLTRDLLRPMAGLPEELAEYQATLDLTAMGLVIEHFHALHNAYPENLHAISSTSDEPLPVDPFSGAPYRYHPGESTFLLYSVGVDLRDHRLCTRHPGSSDDILWRNGERPKDTQETAP